MNPTYALMITKTSFPSTSRLRQIGRRLGFFIAKSFTFGIGHAPSHGFCRHFRTRDVDTDVTATEIDGQDCDSDTAHGFHSLSGKGAHEGPGIPGLSLKPLQGQPFRGSSMRLKTNRRL